MCGAMLVQRARLGLGAVRPRCFARGYSSQAFHERWGKAVLEAALASHVAHRSDALRVLDTLTDPAAVALVALPLQTTGSRLYAHVGELAQTQGIYAASQWVETVYGKYLESSHSVPQTSRPETSRPEKSMPEKSRRNTDSVTQNTAPRAGTTVPEQLSFLEHSNEPAFSGHNATGEMDLFDSETWLTESPTAQRLWKEGSN